MTQQQDDIVKYVFAAVCIAQAVIGIVLSFVALRYSDLAIPEDVVLPNELTFEQINREAFEYVDRRVSLLQARWATIFGQALLFLSLISGLAINFPWLYGLAFIMYAIALCVALYFAGGPFAGIRRLIAYRKLLKGKVRRGFTPLKVIIQPEIAFVLGMSSAQWKLFEVKLLALERETFAVEEKPERAENAPAAETGGEPSAQP